MRDWHDFARQRLSTRSEATSLSLTDYFATLTALRRDAACIRPALLDQLQAWGMALADEFGIDPEHGLTRHEQSLFRQATMRFLRGLDRHNNRDWFHEHKDEFEAHVREPFLALIGDLAEPLAEISSHYRADTRKVGGSLFRIHRDVRFSNNKLPYKPWAGARLFHERRREVAAPSFYIHIQPGNCFVGGGLWHPENHTLRRIRDFMVDNPAAWKKATGSAAFRRHCRCAAKA